MPLFSLVVPGVLVLVPTSRAFCAVPAAPDPTKAFPQSRPPLFVVLAAVQGGSAVVIVGLGALLETAGGEDAS
jgi:hypothetical protein